jgi:hypothetical protein
MMSAYKLLGRLEGMLPVPAAAAAYNVLLLPCNKRHA